MLIETIIRTLIIVYIGVLIGDSIGFLTTSFIRPKGLWNLVPFRVSGWRDKKTGKVYPLKWDWEKIKWE